MKSFHREGNGRTITLELMNQNKFILSSNFFLEDEPTNIIKVSLKPLILLRNMAVLLKRSLKLSISH